LFLDLEKMQAWKKQEEEEGLAQYSTLYVPALKHICKGQYAGMKERRKKEGEREGERKGEGRGRGRGFFGPKSNLWEGDWGFILAHTNTFTETEGCQKPTTVRLIFWGGLAIIHYS
jgi:hypothetical protein